MTQVVDQAVVESVTPCDLPPRPRQTREPPTGARDRTRVEAGPRHMRSNLLNLCVRGGGTGIADLLDQAVSRSWGHQRNTAGPIFSTSSVWVRYRQPSGPMTMWSPRVPPRAKGLVNQASPSQS